MIRQANLQKKLIVLISCTMLGLLLYCFIVFVTTGVKNTRKDLDTYLRNSYYLRKEQLDSYLVRLDYTAYSVIFSNWVQRLLVIDRVASLAEFQEHQRNATHFLSSLSSVNGDLSFVILSGNVMVWSNNSLHYNLQYDITKQPWFRELTDRKKYIEYGKSELFADLDDRWSMTLYYPVINYYNFSLLGYLAINVLGENLNFLLADGGREELITIQDPQGNAVLSNIAGNNRELSEPLWLSLGEPVMDGQWTIDIHVRNSGNPFSGLGSLNLIFLLLIPIVILFIMIIAAFSRYLTSPIVKCKKAMLEIKNRNFGLTLENPYHDEIGELISGFNDMSAELALLIRENAKINALRRKAEIDMLQQKVNPHFLYNTLEIVNALILSGQNASAVRVCELLGKMYHYNLMNRKWVSIKDECEYVKSYLNILKHRMRNLSTAWNTDENAMNTDMLKLILQPLVENAVRHGFSARQADACLAVEVLCRGEKTVIRIMDNGSGINEEDLAEIRETLEAIRCGAVPDSSHIGIPNVYQRLRLEYGDDMEFSIESRLNLGTKVVIMVPKNNIRRQI
jgi:two-component system sensor histidine kinase YesM